MKRVQLTGGLKFETGPNAQRLYSFSLLGPDELGTFVVRVMAENGRTQVGSYDLGFCYLTIEERDE